MELRKGTMSSIKVLENSQITAENELKEILGFDIGENKENELRLSQIGKEIKVLFRNYHQRTSDLLKARLANGCFEQANALREERLYLRREVEETICLINGALEEAERISELSSLLSFSSLNEIDLINRQDRTHSNAATNFAGPSPCSAKAADITVISRSTVDCVGTSHHTEYNEPDGRIGTASVSLDNSMPKSNTSATVSGSVGFAAAHTLIPGEGHFNGPRTQNVTLPLFNLSHSLSQNTLASPSTISTCCNPISTIASLSVYPDQPNNQSNQLYNTYSTSVRPSRLDHSGTVGYTSHSNSPASYLQANPTMMTRPSMNPGPRPPGLMDPTSITYANSLCYGDSSNIPPNTNHLFTPSSIFQRQHSLFSSQYPSTVGSHNYMSGPNASNFYCAQSQAHMRNNVQQSFIDPASLHLIKQSLLKKPETPYNGEPHLFQAFLHQLNSKMKGIPLDPWETICILEVHTSGKPQQIVRSYMINGSANPSESLRNIEEELLQRFGCGIRVANTIIQKIESLSPIRNVYNSDKLDQLLEICKLIDTNMSTIPELQQFNNSTGIQRLWSKLPDQFQNSWRSVYNDYKLMNYGTHPPFSFFLNFIKRKVQEFTDPCYERKPFYEEKRSKEVRNFKTDSTIEENQQENLTNCVIHPQSKHSLEVCKEFVKMESDQKYDTMMKHGLCFKCLGKHLRSQCKETPKCEKCQKNHLTILHIDFNKNERKSNQMHSNRDSFSNLCTKVCKEENMRSCSKTVLVDVFRPGKKEQSLRCYAILDEESSSSFADPKLAAYFNKSSQC